MNYDELVTSLRNQVRRNQTFGLGVHEDTGLMDRAADAIEELKQTVKHYKGCADDWYKEACDYKAAVPRWISVKERLPEKREWVLCLCEADIIDVLRWENNEWYHDPMHVYFPSFVTHWMPLPTPPKEDEA